MTFPESNLLFPMQTTFADVLFLAIISALAGEMADDAFLALPAALAMVCLGHLTEKPQSLAIAVWAKIALLFGSITLAVSVGYVLRQFDHTRQYATLGVIATALFAQDVFMWLTKWKLHFAKRFSPPTKPDHEPDRR